MATATASKPAQSAAAQQSSRQPPTQTVWLKYQPNAEGILSWHASAALHGLILGLIVFLSLASYFGFAKPPHSLPMEAVTFQDAGGSGTKDGTGDGPGDHAPPLKEGVETDKPSSSDKPTDVDRPRLPDEVAKKVDQEFTPNDSRIIKEGPEAMAAFANLDTDIRQTLREGINPSPGKDGPGKDGGKDAGKDKGEGPGTGPGTGKMLNEREKRMLRWSMNFKTHDGNDYLHQLEGLGAILAIPAGEGYKVIDLTKRPLHMEDRDLSTIQRIWWIDENPSSVKSLMAAMGMPGQPARVVAFIPPELEEDIAKKELAYRGLKEDRIYETKFEVVNFGGRYEVRVTGQTEKK